MFVVRGAALMAQRMEDGAGVSTTLVTNHYGLSAGDVRSYSCNLHTLGREREDLKDSCVCVCFGESRLACHVKNTCVFG